MPDLQVNPIAGSAGDPDADGSHRPWTAPLFVALALLLLAFGSTVVSLPVMWWNRFGYLQGFVLAAVVGFVLWRDRDQLLPPGAGSTAPLVPVLLGLSGLWLVSRVMSVQVGFQFAFVLLMTAWGLCVLGLRSWPILLPAGATLVLGVPIWDALIPILRKLAVLMSGLLVRLLGISAEIQGDVITIEWGSFIVENGCAGQAYLLVGLTVGALYSHLFMRGWTTRLGVVALAGGIALLSNWIRITHLVWLGETTRMLSPTLADHGTHGWIVFSLSLIPFFVLARWMERWNAGSRNPSATERASETATDATDGEAGAAGAAGGPPGTGGIPVPSAEQWRRRLVLATVAAVGGPILFHAISLLPPAAVSDVPLQPVEEGWVTSSSASTPDPAVGADGSSRWEADWVIDFVGVDRREIRRWDPELAPVPVRAERLIYDRQRQGAELINGENRIAPDSLVVRERVVGPLDRSGTRVREVWVRSGDQSWLVWYRFRVAGVVTASSTRAKLLELLAFLTRRRQAELMVLTAPCGPESCEPAARSLFRFVTGEELPIQQQEPEGARQTRDGRTRVPGSDAFSDPAQDQSDDASQDRGQDGLR